MEQWLAFGLRPELQFLVFFCAFGSLLSLSSIEDVRSGRLPNNLNLLLFAGGILFASSSYGAGLLDGVAASLCGGGTFYILARGFQLARGYPGLGGGDVKFVAACAPWIGLRGVAPMTLLAAAAALCVIAVVAAAGRPVSRSTSVPFGPFLAFATFLVWGAQVAGFDLFQGGATVSLMGAIR